MNVLIALLLLLPQAQGPDYSALLPAIVDAAEQDMFRGEGPAVDAAVHMGGFVSLLKQETGKDIAVASIAQAFLASGRSASNRAKATDCSQGRWCKFEAPEDLFVEIEDLSVSSGEVIATVRVLANKHDRGRFIMNRFDYHLSWEGERWVLVDRVVRTRA